MADEKNRPGAPLDPAQDAPRDSAHDAPGDLDALPAGLAESLGISWRPGDDPAVILRALENMGGELPDEMQAVLAVILDAAEALESELALRPATSSD